MLHASSRASLREKQASLPVGRDGPVGLAPRLNGRRVGAARREVERSRRRRSAATSRWLRRPSARCPSAGRELVVRAGGRALRAPRRAARVAGVVGAAVGHRRPSARGAAVVDPLEARRRRVGSAVSLAALAAARVGRPHLRRAVARREEREPRPSRLQRGRESSTGPRRDAARLAAGERARPSTSALRCAGGEVDRVSAYATRVPSGEGCTSASALEPHHLGRGEARRRGRRRAARARQATQQQRRRTGEAASGDLRPGSADRALHQDGRRRAAGPELPRTRDRGGRVLARAGREAVAARSSPRAVVVSRYTERSGSEPRRARGPRRRAARRGPGRGSPRRPPRCAAGRPSPCTSRPATPTTRPSSSRTTK